MKELNLAALDQVIGGRQSGVCTPDNPTGAAPQTQLRQGPTSAPQTQQVLPPSYYNVFTSPQDVHGKANAIVNRLGR